MTAAPAPRPDTLRLAESSSIRLEAGAPVALLEEVREALALDNPRYMEAERMGRWTGNIPRYIMAYTDGPEGLQVPRGFGPRLEALARRHGLEVIIEDRTRTLREVDFDFSGRLKPFQEAAVADVLTRPTGTLSAPTASGKTVMALVVIAQRRQPALIIVHTKALLHQWIDRIGAFLGIPAEEVGVIGDGRKDLGDRITVAIINSLYKVADEVSPHIGHLVVDECHRTPSRTFTQAVSAFNCRYLLGLSATPWRRDRLSRLIYWAMGELVHKVRPQALQEAGDILRAEVVWRETAFRTRLDPSEEYPRMLSELTRDEERNALIVRDVAEAAGNGSGIILVLSDRRAHVNALRSMLEARGVPSVALTGGMNTTARAEALEAIRGGNARVLVATGQLIGEGFDLPAMGTLFLSTPIRFDGRVIQYLGRVLRPAPSKDRAVVYDYVDAEVGVLVASARARRHVYGGRPG